FDVIIGNPPYVEYSQVKKSYQVRDYETESAGNLYSFVIENCFKLMNEAGYMGMIVQLPLVCTDRMKPVQHLYSKVSVTAWFANFDDRPGRLFDGLEHIRATIAISKRADAASTRCQLF